MLCNSNNTSYNVSRNFKNGLFCIHTFNYELWNNFGGEISHIVIRFSKFKKRVIRIITSSRMRDSCREVLKKIRNTTLIFSIYLLNINVCEKNKHLFYTNNQIHSIHTRFETNLHPPTANLTKFQKGVYYLAIKIFNNLPHNIRDLANEIVPFRNALKRFLLINSFYSSKEYFNYQRYSIEN